MDSKEKTSKSRKLKVLCLHGYNNTGDIFKFQLKPFMNSFSEVLEFHFLDAPFETPDSPLKTFVDKGFPPPFRSWLSGTT
mmetsp:Transcript_15854/g.15268  ORF Transcript_15854/g.15268 Transcript_15854/m.15268 type:complete len:80 (+) Transcript_15854:3-242(+)